MSTRATKSIFRLTAIALLSVWCASGQGLSLTVGNTEPGQDYLLKNALFVFQVSGCADPLKLRVSATAEGVVAGSRRSVLLNLPPSHSNGVYPVPAQWDNEGKWVVAISVTCQKATGGAIVPVTQNGFVRESTQILPQPPTADQIETALKAYTPRAPLQ